MLVIDDKRRRLLFCHSTITHSAHHHFVHISWDRTLISLSFNHALREREREEDQCQIKTNIAPLENCATFYATINRNLTETVLVATYTRESSYSDISRKKTSSIESPGRLPTGSLPMWTAEWSNCSISIDWYTLNRHMITDEAGEMWCSSSSVIMQKKTTKLLSAHHRAHCRVSVFSAKSHGLDVV